jgi:hypothetical protein
MYRQTIRGPGSVCYTAINLHAVRISNLRDPLIPTVLLATTARWFPTARLATALAAAGFRVEAVCPSGHPLSKTGVAERNHAYNGLRPLHSFASAIAATRPDFIVPGDDLATPHLHQLHRKEISGAGSKSPTCQLIERSIGSSESFPFVFERAAFLELAQELCVRCPETQLVTEPDDLKKWALLHGFPIVLKANGTSGGDGVRIVHNMEEAKGALRKLAAPPLVARAVKRTIVDRDTTLFLPSLLRRRSAVNAQMFVGGHEATSAIACWNGVLLASLHFEVIEKAQALGHATVVRVIENKEMSIAAERIVRRLHLSGFHGFDFMLDAKTGYAHLIEINPRSTQVGHLTLGPGRDLPAALYSAVSGKPVRPARKMTENDTIALFPQEWIRDEASPFLRSCYHDVPWQEPELVNACVLSRRKQRAWYSPGKSSKPLAAVELADFDLLARESDAVDLIAKGSEYQRSQLRH